MSFAGQVVFCCCCVLALVGALSTVLAKIPLRAAMGLLVTVVSLAGLYLTLHAELLATVQLLVYAGAIVVLFIFVIMLIGSARDEEERLQAARGFKTRLVGALLAGLVGTLLAVQLSRVIAEPAVLEQCPPGFGECGQFGGVKALGRELFSSAVIPFELLSVLLTAAIVGAIAIARGRATPSGGGHTEPGAGASQDAGGGQ